MTADLIQLQPRDEHNERLAAHVHPPDWQNPTPSGRYHLVVIGAGMSGLLAAHALSGTPRLEEIVGYDHP